MSNESRQPLARQRAIVTGASSGIGAAIARGFAAAGAVVGINYHSNAEAAEEIVSEVQAAGGQAIALKADVSSEHEVRGMFESFLTAFGRVDILVANSGIQMDAAAAEMSLDQWQRILDVNLTGQFLCAREVVRRPGVRGRSVTCGGQDHLHELGSRGHPWVGHVNHAAAKGGVPLAKDPLGWTWRRCGDIVPPIPARTV